ncbi:MAG: hypothetical protein CM15mP84_06090 [Cellvibrionales bacterium]|nr:MAG: hypothetical protein CM15mP84_06090 [Cellvibrionales bacterium]
MMEAVEDGAEEVLLFNERGELTEAAACNVFIVSGGAVLTPELDHQILPGVTRRQCIELLSATPTGRSKRDLCTLKKC